MTLGRGGLKVSLRIGQRHSNNLPRTNHEASLLMMRAMFGRVSASERFVEAVAGQR